MDAYDLLDELGLGGAGYAAPVEGGPGVGFKEHEPVAPASIMKVQIALAVEELIATGAVDGAAPQVLPPGGRTPGPTGVSLMQDQVTMSVRDLVVAMLTISDNVATDYLVDLAGLDRINQTTAALGLGGTEIASDVGGMLEAVAQEVGFRRFADMAAHSPERDGPPSDDEVKRKIAESATLDPARGTHTTASDAVSLLQAIWTDRAGSAAACARVRTIMAKQLARDRIASGFEPSATVAAKSGALLGVVRNEAGVVTYPDGSRFAVAVFTRKEPGNATPPAAIDRTIGRIARRLVDHLHDSG